VVGCDVDRAAHALVPTRKEFVETGFPTARFADRPLGGIHGCATDYALPTERLDTEPPPCAPDLDGGGIEIERRVGQPPPRVASSIDRRPRAEARRAHGGEQNIAARSHSAVRKLLRPEDED